MTGFLKQPAIQVLIDNAGHVTSAQLAAAIGAIPSGGLSQSAVQALIDAAGHATMAQLAEFIATVMAGGGITAEQVQALIDGSGHATQANITAAINALSIPTPFDVHDDVTTQNTAPADFDRIPHSDESVTGDPNKYFRLSVLREYFRRNAARYVCADTEPFGLHRSIEQADYPDTEDSATDIRPDREFTSDRRRRRGRNREQHRRFVGHDHCACDDSFNGSTPNRELGVDDNGRHAYRTEQGR